MRYAIISSIDIPDQVFRGATIHGARKNTVVNIILLDDPTQWTAPVNTVIVRSDVLNIGDVYTP